jgi:hypothetical protein
MAQVVSVNTQQNQSSMYATAAGQKIRNTLPQSQPSILKDMLQDAHFNSTLSSSSSSNKNNTPTWTDALSEAERKQSQEEKHPKYLHLGSNALEKFIYRTGFAPNKFFKVYQCIGGIALVPVAFFLLHSLGYGIFSSTGMTLAMFNFFIKGPSIGSLFQHRNSIVYKIPRMMPTELYEETKQASGIFVCQGWSIFIMLFMTTLNIAVSALFFLRFFTESSVTRNTLFLLFNFLFFGVNHMYLVTFQFIGLAKGLRKMIDNFTLIAYTEKDPRRIDWRNAYSNYHILADTVVEFSQGFAVYFFLAEFFLVVAYVCVLIAVIIESIQLISLSSSSSSSEMEKVEQIIRVVTMAAMVLTYTRICFDLFSAAASVTGACQRLKNKAHRLCALVEWEDPESLPVAHRFYEHVERGEKGLGFKSMGILVSPSLAAKLAYVFSSAGSAAVLYLLRTTK